MMMKKFDMAETKKTLTVAPQQQQHQQLEEGSLWQGTESIELRGRGGGSGSGGRAMRWAAVAVAVAVMGEAR